MQLNNAIHSERGCQWYSRVEVEMPLNGLGEMSSVIDGYIQPGSLVSTLRMLSSVPELMESLSAEQE